MSCVNGGMPGGPAMNSTSIDISLKNGCDCWGWGDNTALVEGIHQHEST